MTTRLIDLTQPLADTPPCILFDGPMFATDTKDIPLESPLGPYTGRVFTLHLASMSGTYIDFPGHICEHDDGRTAQTASPADFYRLPAAVIHLNRPSGSGAVTADDLRQAFPADACQRDFDTPPTAFVINALGRLNPWDIEERTVWLDPSAIDWLLAQNCRLLISDVYESLRQEGNFQKLFAAGACTVCMPVNLFLLPDTARLTLTFLPWPNVTQMPCRLLAEIDG